MRSLRRKDLESLTWIGSQQDLELPYNDIVKWPLELREAWYLALAAIQGPGYNLLEIIPPAYSSSIWLLP